MNDFNLQQAVEAWVSLLKREHMVDEAHIDELQDHLMCEIESRIAEGLSAKSAFTCAVDSIRQHPLLKDNEKVKNRLFNKLIELECGKQQTPDNYKRAKVIVTQSILWAAAMLASAILVGDHPNSKYLTIFVYVPLALMSIFSLNSKRKVVNK